MIVDHAWRPPNKRRGRQDPPPDRPCEYMSCGQPRGEHERAVAAGPRQRRGGTS